MYYDWHCRLWIFSYLYLFINGMKSFISPEIYSVLNPIIEVCQRIECFWRTVILFWNISICSSWKEASKDQRGSYRKSSWDDVSLERKYILQRNIFVCRTIFLYSKSILVWLLRRIDYYISNISGFKNGSQVIWLYFSFVFLKTR